MTCKSKLSCFRPFATEPPWRPTLSVLHQHWILGLRVYLNPSAGVVQHRNTVLIVNLHGARVRKRLLKRPMVMGDSQGALADHVRIGQQFLFTPLRQLVITSEAGNEAAVRSSDLDAVVLPVGHVNVAVLI